MALTRQMMIYSNDLSRYKGSKISGLILNKMRRSTQSRNATNSRPAQKPNPFRIAKLDA